jgi:hypothetical protein
VNAIFSNIAPFERGFALLAARALPGVLALALFVFRLALEALPDFACFEFVRVGFALADRFARLFTGVDFFAAALRFAAMP